jgi:hypothetical protein
MRPYRMLPNLELPALQRIKSQLTDDMDCRLNSTFREPVTRKKRVIPNYLSKVALLVVLSLITVSAPQAYLSPIPPSEDVATIVSRSADKFFKSAPQAVGLTVGVLKDGKTYTYNYGTIQKGKKDSPSADTLYQIASITKIHRNSPRRGGARKESKVRRRCAKVPGWRLSESGMPGSVHPAGPTRESQFRTAFQFAGYSRKPACLRWDSIGRCCIPDRIPASGKREISPAS